MDSSTIAFSGITIKNSSGKPSSALVIDPIHKRFCLIRGIAGQNNDSQDLVKGLAASFLKNKDNNMQWLDSQNRICFEEMKNKKIDERCSANLLIGDYSESNQFRFIQVGSGYSESFSTAQDFCIRLDFSPQGTLGMQEKINYSINHFLLKNGAVAFALGDFVNFFSDDKRQLLASTVLSCPLQEFRSLAANMVLQQDFTARLGGVLAIFTARDV